MNKNYRLFLYKPSAASYIVNSAEYRAEFFGELRADNINASIKLQDISSLSFELPENILGEFNTRLSEVLDNYVVELWYGDLTGTQLDNTGFPLTGDRIRFIINSSRLEYSNGVKKYRFEASSLEFALEFKQLLNWPGIQVKDFFRTISYDKIDKNFAETPASGVTIPDYAILRSTNTQQTRYITVPTTTAGTAQVPSTFDIFIYQHRRNDDDTISSENSVIEYETATSAELASVIAEEGFKPGFYIPVLDSNGKVASLVISIPDDILEFKADGTNFDIQLYDNPTSRHFAIGINTDQEVKASDMYLDLAQEQPTKFTGEFNVVFNSEGRIPDVLIFRDNKFSVAWNTLSGKLKVGQKITPFEGMPDNTTILEIIQDNTVYFPTIRISNNYTGSALKVNLEFSSFLDSEYRNYKFTTQTFYSINGLKLEHILLGTQETRNSSNVIVNSSLTGDGILFDTDFTIGEIETSIAAKYRSNIELNNITKYEAIKNIAESFDAIPVYDTINKTVSFYPDKNEAFTNRGLIITEKNYLKDISNDINSTKIITKALAAGKDNLGIELITPNGGAAWEDYSYYLDSYYVNYPNTSVTGVYNSIKGINFTAFPDGTLARWIEQAEAIKLSEWQYARDYFHDIALGNLNPSITEHKRYYNLYNLRSEAINNFVKNESKFFELKATEFKYKYLYEYYVKENSNSNANNTRKLVLDYLFDSSTTVSDPGINKFKLNSGSFQNVTKIIIDNIQTLVIEKPVGSEIFQVVSINRRDFLSTVGRNTNPRVILSDKTDFENGLPTNFVSYEINSVDTDSSGYVVLNVTFIDKTGSGTSFTNLNPTLLNFVTWEEIYKIKYENAVAASAAELIKLNELHYQIYNQRSDGTEIKVGDADFTTLNTIRQNSFATKISEIQKFLNKESSWGINIIKLKAFEKSSTMTDSKLDNELDLIKAVQEFLKENSKPVITLEIDVIDFLASDQSKVDWDKAKIGDVVNIYFQEFNINTEAQLREIDIDFQNNTLKFVVSNYRQYSRTPLTFIAMRIRETYDDKRNLISSTHDKNKNGANITKEFEKEFKETGFDTGVAGMFLGSKDIFGNFSTILRGDGFISNVVNVDPILETITIDTTKNLTIADGTTTASNQNTESGLTTQVEISGDNGLVIRKIQNGVVDTQMSVDVGGNAVFSGFVSVGQPDVGYDNDGIFLGVSGGNPTISFKTTDIDDNVTFLKYDPTAEFDLEVVGNAKIGPVFVGNTGNSITSISNSGSGLIYFSGEEVQLDDDGESVTFNFEDQTLEVIGGGIQILLPVGESLTGNFTISVTFYDDEDGTGNSLGEFITPLITDLNRDFDFNARTVVKPRSCVVLFSLNTLSTNGFVPITNISFAGYKPAIQINNFNVSSFGETTTNKLSIINNDKSEDGIILQNSGAGDSFNRIVLRTPSSSLTGTRTIRFPDADGTILLNTTLSLNSLSDVTISSPADGQVLKYNSSTSRWENADEEGGGGGFTIFVQENEPTTDVAGDFWYEVTGTYP